MVGERLAARLALPFVDCDKEIEKAVRLSIAELVRTGGGDYRKIEQHFVQALARSHPQVAALGGEAFADVEIRTRLREMTVTIWLDPSFERLLSRRQRLSTHRFPAVRNEQLYRQLWEERQKNYSEAQFRVAVDSDDPEVTVDAILRVMADPVQDVLPGTRALLERTQKR